MTASTRKSLTLGIYAGVFLLIVLLNKLLESSCWFYSDARGEYSVSELLTNALYLLAAIFLGRRAWRRKSIFLWSCAGLAFLLLMEECNWGQIFWSQEDSNFHANEEQAALHTQMLRPIYVFGTMDGAEFLSLCMLGFFMILIPGFLRFWLKLDLSPLLLWTPFALTCFCQIGKWAGILIPWSCGYDSGEEVLETLMAATALYWTILHGLSQKRTPSVTAANG